MCFLLALSESLSFINMFRLSIIQGLSKHFKFGEVQHEAVGTPYTVAPEVIRGSYDERCDVWAIGKYCMLLHIVEEMGFVQIYSYIRTSTIQVLSPTYY